MFILFFAVNSIPYVASYLDSILRNLVSNAIKHRHDERPLRLSITTRAESDGVRDNGTGMDLDRHGDNLFQPSHRLTQQRDGNRVSLLAQIVSRQVIICKKPKRSF